MKTKTIRKNKINVVTLGCSKNIVDSENLMAQLKANNYDVSHQSTDRNAEIIIINTCGFIENAKKESIDTILQYAEAKESGKIDKLYVTGCLSQRYKTDLEKEIPNVDQYFGTNDLPRLLKTLRANYKHELVGERLLTTPAHFAYLKISEGCNRGCAFCAIPIMRGKHVSKTMEYLVKETQSLTRKGTKELILIAQDLSSYGIDIYKKQMLSTLLERLSDIDGIEWIRLHYAYPSKFPMDVLNVMNKRENICRYLDIPLQHISDSMLKSMRRGINRKRSMDLINEIRECVPGIAIRTTILVGFPGETENDFKQLVNFVESARFDRLGVFTYSHEEGTAAYNFKDDVPLHIKMNRSETIMKIQKQISLQHNMKRVGKTYKVLFDKAEGDYFVGRTEFDSPEVDNEVLIDKRTNYVRIGDFSDIKITDAAAYDLYGKNV